MNERQSVFFAPSQFTVTRRNSQRASNNECRNFAGATLACLERGIFYTSTLPACNNVVFPEDNFEAAKVRTPTSSIELPSKRP